MGVGRKKAPGWAGKGAEQKGQGQAGRHVWWGGGVKPRRGPTMHNTEAPQATAKRATESGERAMD